MSMFKLKGLYFH